MPLTIPKIEQILEPGAQALGLELVAVEMAGGDRAILRIYIDAADGVTVDDCVKASRQFGAILDVEDPIANRYTLEVSSPGIDRPLAQAKHFAAAVGETARIKMASLVNGRRRFKGEIQSVEGEQIVLRVEGEDVILTLSDMDKARLVPDLDVKTLLEKADSKTEH